MDFQRIRLLPGIIIVVIQWLIRFGVPVAFPAAAAFGVLGGLAGWLAMVIWWMFFSRVPRTDRWGTFVVMIFAIIGTIPLTHESIKTGMQGMMPFVLMLPVLSLVFIIWAVAARNLSVVPRRVSMIIAILLACGVWTLVRSRGITGDAAIDLTWRWTKTHEEQLLANKDKSAGMLPVITDTIAEWPGFRGPNRDGIIHGVQIETDWQNSPPVELWRKPVGPGCSSFAVQGKLLFTQEQLGEYEIVSCYNVETGEPVWKHQDSARFWDSHAGAGPRSTPTLHNNRVYTLGATGILNVLNMADGSVIWSENAAGDTEVEMPGWAYCASPLVVNNVVIIALSGKVMAYDIESGALAWEGPDGGESYSSPQLLTIDGIEQVLFLSKAGAISFDPSSGEILWDYEWPRVRIVQPAVTENGDLLITYSETGLRKVSVKKEKDEWTFNEQWTSGDIRPNFNDFVVHKGHAYGFFGPMLACIDLETGARKWKGGRYGGQILLLADQDLLVISSEKGEIALVEAKPEQFNELAKMQAIEGKTWNHPVMVDDVLLVRNTREMAAFKMMKATTSKGS